MDVVAEKACFKCNVIKPPEDFYRQASMADGRFGKCKECTKADVRANRAAKREYYAEYERRRFSTPARQATRAKQQRLHRQRHPDKYIARSAVGNAVRDGRLTKPTFCGCCGREGKVQAHHTDYSRPLDVAWLCFVCHREYGHEQVVTQRDYEQ